MSISSLSSSSTVQHTINNSSTYVYEHFEFIFVAFSTLINIYFYKIIQIWELCIYTKFVNCAGNYCLLCWYRYAEAYYIHLIVSPHSTDLLAFLKIL